MTDSKPPAEDVKSFVKWCKEHNIEEVLVTHKRRDRLGSILGSAALVLTLSLGAWFYNDGIRSARVEEQLRARVAHLEESNNERRGIREQLVRLESSVTALGTQVDTRFGALEQRLDRAEDNGRPARSRRR